MWDGEIRDSDDVYCKLPFTIIFNSLFCGINIKDLLTAACTHTPFTLQYNFNNTLCDKWHCILLASCH